MSHFTVLVVGEDVEKQLFPFWELDLNREEIRKDPRAEFKVEVPEKELLSRFQAWRSTMEERIEEGKKSGKSDAMKYAVESLEKYKTAKAWVKEYNGYDYMKGKGWGFWRNPNSKWDWYSVGGRWTGFFPLKKGANGEIGRPGLMTPEAKDGYVDSALKKDIDFDLMIQGNIEQARKDWDEYQEKSEDTGGVNAWLFGIKPGDTKEKYVKRNTWWTTFAVLKDGKWYEKGEMGWWACVSNEKDQDHWDEEFGKLVEDLPEDTRLTIVDAHI